MQEGIESELAGSAIEHRWGARINCNAHVHCSTEIDISGDGRLHDVSMSGAFIETRLPLPLYSQIAVGIINEDGSVRDPIRATVVRTEATGVGIEWRDLVEGPVCPALGCTTMCQAAEKIFGPREPADPQR